MPSETIHTVKYKCDNGQVASCLPTRKLWEAESIRDDINTREPWRVAEIITKTVEVIEQKVPTCFKCNAVKVHDLFKGEYCPSCNDWC